MDNRFKLIISNSLVYKEISLSSKEKNLSIGTYVSSKIRVYEEDFIEPFELYLENNHGDWQMFCMNSQYIDLENNKKLIKITLNHGMKCSIISKTNNQKICDVFCMIDFDYNIRCYDVVINMKKVEKFVIGTGAQCDIVLLGEYITSNQVEIINYKNEIQLYIKNMDFGVCYNGIPVRHNCRVKNADFFSIGSFNFYYRNQQLFITDGDHLMIKNLEFLKIKDSQSSMEYPKFNRNTKINLQIPDKTIEILDPPNLPPKTEENLFMHILPSVIMLIMIIAIRGFMSGGNGTNISYLLFSIGSMGIGIMTSIFSYMNNKKKYEEELKEREEVYTNYIEKKREQIQKKRGEEAALLNKKYVSEKVNIRMIEEFSGDLFDRSIEDIDFLKIRLGSGSYEAFWKIKYLSKEKITQNDQLSLIPQKMAKEFAFVNQVPVCSDLLKAHNIGITGSESARYQMLKIITLDLCTHHYFKDIKLFFVFNEKRKKQFEWIRFLPHVQNDDIEIRNIICDESSKTWQYEWLYKELSYRDMVGKKKQMKHIVILLVDDMGIKRHPISKYFKKAHELNVHFIAFEGYKEQLPMYCGEIIKLDNSGRAELIEVDSGKISCKFQVEDLDDTVMHRLAVKLAPVYSEEITLESKLTKNISLFELLGVFSAEDLDLKQRWQESDICKTMAAPLGVKAKNEIIFLDLHEKADGPHGLVAGTTGSGKSEILQTYVLSMSTLYSPHEVAFVIIDFKGGGMANQFRNLPHLVGVITDIDGKEINRSLLSIRAELDKRKELFAKAEVNNINNYIKKYQAGDIDVPLPHLIIIVDEFAELKAEQPEFMKELISTSRIGRSLGVHLILATQKPAGQVSDQIWSNSRFKLCLKVQTKEDSNEVIRSPLAAEIIEPGRAYIQVGNNEIFELFQSAYCGALEKSNDDKLKGKSYIISEVDLAGRRKIIFEQKMEKDNEKGRTQLEATVEHIQLYCAKNRIEKLPNICLPSLPECINCPSTIVQQKESFIYAYIGIYDAPEKQYQGKIRISFTGNNTLIIGSAQYGKTNLLQTIVRELTLNYTPKELNIYILDFGSMIFRNYEDLNHIGGIVYSYEEEKCKNLFKMLNKEIDERKEKLANSGVSSFVAYREAGFYDLPQIIVIIDNLTAMRELYLMENDFLLPLCREGLAVGISFVIANMQTSGIGYRYLANFEQRIALFCNDITEYNTLFNHCRIQPSNIPGRCLIELDKEIYEAQTYLAFDGEKEYDRVQQIHKFVEKCNIKYINMKSKEIPIVPKILTQEILGDKFKVTTNQEKFVVGLDFASVSPIELSWMKQGILAISGKQEKTKKDFLLYIQNILSKIDSEVYILDDYEGVFDRFSECSNVRLYSKSLEDIGEILEDIKMNLEERFQQREMKGIHTVELLTPIVFLIQNQEAITSISNNKNNLTIYKEILSRYKGLKCCIVFTNMENTSITFNSPEVLKMMKEDRQLLLFDNLSEVKLFDCPSSLLRKYKNPLEDGEGFLLLGNNLSKIKIVSL